MSSGSPRYQAASDQPSARKADRCAHANAMLDRYGIAYVCQHPEILFGEPPLTEYGGMPYVQGSGLNGARETPFEPFGKPLGTRPHRKDDLVQRSVEAYHILREIYAPWPMPQYDGGPGGAQAAEQDEAPSERADGRCRQPRRR